MESSRAATGLDHISGLSKDLLVTILAGLHSTTAATRTGALGGFKSGVGMDGGQLDVDIVHDRVGFELQRTYEVGCSFSCSRSCCHTGLVHGNIREPKAKY
jgi:hypothetical protein